MSATAHCDAGSSANLVRPSDQSSTVLRALKRIPTIGEVTAQKLIEDVRRSFLASMLGDNLHNSST
jgi:hypothetical protein